jgi:hypothetical protein
MNIQHTNRGIEVKTNSYRLLLDNEGGYSVREVEIEGIGRLDRFDRPGEGPHPTCMYFDNCTVNYAFQQGHYGKANTKVTAKIEEELTVSLAGYLIPITEDAHGRIALQKRISFEEDAYEVHLRLKFEETDRISYVSAWWDVNDTWLRAMRSSNGVFMPLRVGIGDCFGDDLSRSWRSMDAMDRGAGIWMEMIGESASIMVAAISVPQEILEYGGMKYWDGPDDKDAGEGVSHGCINLDWINCELTGTEPVRVDHLETSYKVFLSGPTELRT